jgi:hypothetical protein
MRNEASEYIEQATAFCKASGRPDGKWPVIDRLDNPHQWSAWVDYFKGRGMRASVRAMLDGGKSKWTVPAMWPHEFDAGAQAPKQRAA